MSRKATGTLVKTKSGRWQAIVRFVDGSRRRLPPFQAGMTEAQALKATHEAQARILKQGIAPATPSPAATRKVQKGATTDAWFEVWAGERDAKGHTSVRDDRGRYRLHISPVIGEKPIVEVCRNDIEAIVGRLDAAVRAGSMSWKTAANTWGVLSKMFDDAHTSKVPSLRVRADNPTKDVQGPDRGKKKAKTYLYPSEFLRLVGCESVPLHWRRRVAVAVYLGLRAGELDALEWKDIDIDRATINVRRALDRSRDGAEKTTKTGTNRRFSIEPELMPLLCQMKREAGEARVFQELDPTSYSPRLRTFLGRAGVDRAELSETTETTKQMGWHDLRATSATWRAVRGDTGVAIAHVMGHNNVQTTLGYIREAQGIAEGFGTVFPALPECLINPSESVRLLQYAPLDGVETTELEGVAVEGPSTNPAEFVSEPPDQRFQIPLGTQITSLISGVFAYLGIRERHF